jgi:hypothetical protein
VVKLQERPDYHRLRGTRGGRMMPTCTSRYRVASSIAQTRAAFRRRAKLQVEINEAWRDKNGIKAGDDWRRGIIGDLKDSDWVFSFLSRHSIRDPDVCLDELGLGVSRERRGDCNRAHRRRDRAALRARLRPMRQSRDGRGAARHSGAAGESQKRHPHGGAAYRDMHGAASSLGSLGRLGPERLSSAFSLGQSPEALSRNG